MTEGRFGPPDDRALMSAIAAGSESALAALYDRHVDVVFATAVRLTGDRQVAEEVVQETFLTVWNRAEQFDPGLGSLAAWMLTIARNRSVDRLRAAGRRPRTVQIIGLVDESDQAAFERLVAGGTVVGSGADVASPDQALDSIELTTAIRSALAEIDETERAVIVLAYRDQLTQVEIAERLGWPLGTVKTRTRRGLRRLREILAGEFGPPPVPQSREPAGVVDPGAGPP